MESLVPRDVREAFAVVDADGLVLAADDHVMPIYSVTKMYIAATVLALELDLDAPVSRWLGVDLLARADEITLVQLLTHSSGVRDYGALPAYGQAIASGQLPWSDAEFAEHTLRKPLLFEPGQGWSYSNPGFWLLVQVAERASGEPFAELLTRLVCQPLGLSSCRLADGVFAEALRGYAAGWVWHRLILSNMCDVARFLASPLVARLKQRLVKVPVDHPDWRDAHYGLGVMCEPGDRWGHNGGGPAFNAAAFRFEDCGVCGCVVRQNAPEQSQREDALPRLLELVAGLCGGK